MLWLLCLALVLPSIEGFCSVAPVKIRKTASGRNLTVCTLINGLEILNGSTVVLASCESCKCEEKQLSCCGFGHMAGKTKTPPQPKHCKKIIDGCNEIVVKKSDETRECFTGKSILVNRPPTFPSMWPYSGYNQQYSYSNMIGGQPSLPDFRNWIDPRFMDTTPTRRQIASQNTIMPKPRPDPGHPESASQIFNGHSNGASRMFNGNSNDASRIFNGHSNGAFRILNGPRNTASQIFNENSNPPMGNQYIDRRFTHPNAFSQDPYPFGPYFA